MPWGLTRFHDSGQSHFVTFFCYHRRRLLTTDESRRIFESALERVRRSYGVQVYGYVVMLEHVHLLLSEPQRDTSGTQMQSSVVPTLRKSRRVGQPRSWLCNRGPAPKSSDVVVRGAHLSKTATSGAASVVAAQAWACARMRPRFAPKPES